MTTAKDNEKADQFIKTVFNDIGHASTDAIASCFILALAEARQEGMNEGIKQGLCVALAHAATSKTTKDVFRIINRELDILAEANAARSVVEKKI